MPPRISSEVESSLKQHVEQQKCSHLNKAQYCRQHNLSYDQFQYMSRKVSTQEGVTETQAKASASSDFVPLVIQPTHNNAQLTQNAFSIIRANGSRLEWTCDWSAEQVAYFIAQWEGSQ